MIHPNREAILSAFNKTFIFFPTFQFAYSQLQRSVEATRLRQTASCSFLIGPSGSGKSRLCKLFRNSFGPPYEQVGEDGICKVTPALYCLVASPANIKGFCTRLLRQLGEYRHQATTAELSENLLARLVTCKVQVMIFDEIQRLTKPDAEKTRQSTIDWLVALLSLSKIAIILAGDQDCNKLFTSISADSPFWRRYCYPANLNYFDFDDNPTSELYLTLKGLDEQLYNLTKFQGDVHLYQSSIIEPLYVASSGSLETIRLILHEALNMSLIRNDSLIKRSDFFNACNCLLLPLNLNKKTNPFLLSQQECYDLIIKFENEKLNIPSATA
ncbi:TPA: ATP-binding protein [Pseudomonas putida]|uniref:TniB family NTP-binding protein n=1 Tax=Pseudomonas putida TaxID=303 RepID=UPI0023632406|nr:TniB family NTP-binding protein [Pseudomonas putida]MDD2010292.1 ATP-binding protein [Pseudomonas putida]HDS1776878.1 ATP-binding protein [Pseudomonas putida]